MKKSFIYCGRVNKKLADMICNLMGLGLGDLDIEKFADSEPWYRIVDHEKIGPDDVACVVQSTSEFAPSTYFDLFGPLYALRKLNPRKVVAVMPFMGFRRQERDLEGGEAVMAKLMTELIAAAGATDVILCDIHNPCILEYFREAGVRPFEINANSLFVKEFAGIDLNDYVVVAPDKGRYETAAQLANTLNLPLLGATKNRPEYDIAKIKPIDGNLKGKHVILRDDEISTAGTTASSAERAEELGALDMTILVTHGVLAGGAIQKLKRRPFIAKVITTDSIYLPWEKRIPKIKVISIAPLIVEMINQIVES